MTTSPAPPPPNVRLRYSSFSGGMDPDILQRGLTGLSQSYTTVPDGVEFSAGSHRAKLLHIHDFVNREKLPDFAELWRRAVPSTPKQNMNPENIEAVRNDAKVLLRDRRFGDFAWIPTMPKPEYGHPLAWQAMMLEHVLLPAFFDVFPAGQVLRVSYTLPFSSYMAAIHVLKRMQLFGENRAALELTMGRNSLGSLGLNHPAELLQHCLDLVFAIFYPRVHGFVMSLLQEHFLLFLLPNGQALPKDKPPSLALLAPGLMNLMNYSTTPVALSPDQVLERRRHEFDRRELYPISELKQYCFNYVNFLNETLLWLTDASNFAGRQTSAEVASGRIPDFDLNFAWHAYLTFHFIIVQTITDLALVSEYDRKMSFFDVVDQHAGLVDVSTSMDNFETLVSRQYSNSVISPALGRYGGLVAADFQRALNEIRDSNSAAVSHGLLYGRATHNQVTLLTRLGPQILSDDEFEAKLLRALRNSKHGFSLRDPEILAMHDGSVSNEFPDYALALALGLLADRSAYRLSR